MTNTTKRTRAEAKKLMWEYYRDNRTWLPEWIREFREDVITGLMAGLSVETVFAGILESVDSDTDEARAA